MKKILIIDDEEAIREMMIQVLQGEGYVVLEASDGKMGLKIYKEEKFDLVITDIVMPEKEGIETIIELKKVCPDVKIIAISGGGRIHPYNYLAMAKELGADRVFSKPFDLDEFLKAISELVK